MGTGAPVLQSETTSRLQSPLCADGCSITPCTREAGKGWPSTPLKPQALIILRLKWWKPLSLPPFWLSDKNLKNVILSMDLSKDQGQDSELFRGLYQAAFVLLDLGHSELAVVGSL